MQTGRAPEAQMSADREGSRGSSDYRQEPDGLVDYTDWTEKSSLFFARFS